jgi:predicted negative regulator of RcsB-dependent stress response
MPSQFLNRFTRRSIIIGTILGLLIVSFTYGYLYWQNEQLKNENAQMLSQFQQANPSLTITKHNDMISIDPNTSSAIKP